MQARRCGDANSTIFKQILDDGEFRDLLGDLPPEAGVRAVARGCLTLSATPHDGVASTSKLAVTRFVSEDRDHGGARQQHAWSAGTVRGVRGRAAMGRAARRAPRDEGERRIGGRRPERCAGGARRSRRSSSSLPSSVRSRNSASPCCVSAIGYRPSAIGYRLSAIGSA